MATQIRKLTNSNVYIDGTSFLGQAMEVELPSIIQKMAEHSALGMVGTIELPSGVDKLEAKIKWNSYYPAAMKATGNPNVATQMQLRGNLQTWESSALTEQVAAVVYMTATFKSFPLGNFKQHENVELEQDLAVYYVKVEIDGEEIIEFDAMSNIYKVNGVDILAEYRQNLGI